MSAGLRVMRPVRTQPGPHTPGPSAAGPGCTTRPHKTHISDRREVCYPWHPWAGRHVLVVSTFTRAGRAMLRCQLASDDRGPPLELPDWMFDRASCDRMRLAPSPVASADSLLALRVLLNGVGPTTEHRNRVQERHRPTSPSGDADASPATSPPARPVHPTTDPPELGRAPARGPSEGANASRPATPGHARPTPRRRRRQGGAS
jgi:hypothetical protein